MLGSELLNLIEIAPQISHKGNLTIYIIIFLAFYCFPFITMLKSYKFLRSVPFHAALRYRVPLIPLYFHCVCINYLSKCNLDFLFGLMFFFIR